MTIELEGKKRDVDREEVAIDMRHIFSDRKEIDPDLSDLDRGIKLLSEAMFAHAETENNYEEIVNHLIQENERNEELLARYRASEKRWNRYKWAGACLTVTAIAVVLFADLFDQSLDTTEGSEKTVRRVLISVGAVLTFLTSSFSGFSYWKEGKNRAQYKRRLGLQQIDNEMVKKVRIVFENWGALQRAHEDRLAEVDISKSAKQCFKNIKELPDDKDLPSKSTMASMTLQLLSDEHPVKQTAMRIKELEEKITPRDLDDDDGGFVDLGQKGTLDLSSEVSDVEYQIAMQWRTLQQQMGGLYIDEFYHNKNRICRRDARKP